MKKEFMITTETGIHARKATRLVGKANLFKSKITLRYNHTTIDLKSIMGMMSLGIGPGSSIVIEAIGPDENDAMESLALLIREMNMEDER